jgi:hypothetical protein
VSDAFLQCNAMFAEFAFRTVRSTVRNVESLSVAKAQEGLGLIAQQESGAAIVIEHRFYGESNPLPDLSDESLQLLNIQQALDDFEYFAFNVELPMPNGTEVTPDTAPWIIVGGSYSGQLASYAMIK